MGAPPHLPILFTQSFAACLIPVNSPLNTSYVLVVEDVKYWVRRPYNIACGIAFVSAWTVVNFVDGIRVENDALGIVLKLVSVSYFGYIFKRHFFAHDLPSCRFDDCLVALIHSNVELFLQIDRPK